MLTTTRRALLVGSAAAFAFTALPPLVAAQEMRFAPPPSPLWEGYGLTALQQFYDELPRMNPMAISCLVVSASAYKNWRTELMAHPFEHQQLDVLDWLEHQGVIRLVADEPLKQGWFTTDGMA